MIPVPSGTPLKSISRFWVYSSTKFPGNSGTNVDETLYLTYVLCNVRYDLQFFMYAAQTLPWHSYISHSNIMKYCDHIPPGWKDRGFIIQLCEEHYCMIRRKSSVCRKRYHIVDMIRFRLACWRTQCFTFMGTLFNMPNGATYTWVKPVVPLPPTPMWMSSRRGDRLGSVIQTRYWSVFLVYYIPFIAALTRIPVPSILTTRPSPVGNSPAMYLKSFWFECFILPTVCLWHRGCTLSRRYGFSVCQRRLYGLFDTSYSSRIWSTVMSGIIHSIIKLEYFKLRFFAMRVVRRLRA